jgi:hypothetical protein
MGKINATMLQLAIRNNCLFVLQKQLKQPRLQGQLYFSSYAVPAGIASADFLNLAVTGRREK